MSLSERVTQGMRKGVKAAIMEVFVETPTHTRLTAIELAAKLPHSDSTVRSAASHIVAAGFLFSEKRLSVRRYWIEPSQVSAWRHLFDDEETSS